MGVAEVLDQDGMDNEGHAHNKMTCHKLEVDFHSTAMGNVAGQGTWDHMVEDLHLYPDTLVEIYAHLCSQTFQVVEGNRSSYEGASVGIEGSVGRP